MASDWYARWAAHHAQTFGLRDDGDLLALLTWEDALAATEAELRGATDWLMVNPGAFGNTEARFAGKLAMHLGALQAALRELRGIAYRQELSAADDYGRCTRCGTSGRVIVPHVSSIVDGEWRPMKVARAGAVYYTMAVWCSCRLGRWMEGRHNAKWGTVLNLDQYARKNPRWEIQLAKERSQQTAKTAMGRPNREWAELMERLMEQHGIPT